MIKDYKDTLFLPQTNFPMRASLVKKEPEMIAFWKNQNLWKQLREKSHARERFILHDGPPYANGHLHLGHALNKILKDVINRSWQMRGFDANYIPGWDCHGLPIEWKVEEYFRKQGKNKDDVPVIEFRRHCRDFAKKWIDIQREEFIRLGVAADWENPYLTMDYKAEAKIASEISHFLFDGSLYRGSKPVMWSVVEKTALAEAEIEYKDHQSTSVWVGFDILDAADTVFKNASIAIWTTTPWTLPANQALAYHKEFDYAVFVSRHGKWADRKWVVARDLLDDFSNRIDSAEGDIIAVIKGKDFPKDLRCAHPLRGQGYDRDVIVRNASFVTSDQGTGFVHIAPGHGTEDYLFGLEHNLQAEDTVNEMGCFYDQVPLFAGCSVYRHSDGSEGNANKVIIEALEKAGKLLAHSKITHSYPHSWRSKAPLIFRNTAQWFISMEKNDLRKKALRAIDETAFFPSEGRDRLYNMITDRPDWCVSRQRSWGVPLPIFINRKTGEALRDQAVMDRIIACFEKEGTDAWFKRDIKDFLGPDYNAEDMIQVQDVVDVWFDSGSTHAFVLEERDDTAWPASLYLEGTDQHRGWFHSSLLQSCATRGRAPYDALLTHGFLLDEKGHKMSKSVGNIITPQQIIDQYGADILRLWVVSSNYSDDLRIGHDILKQNVDMYRRLRNTLRWLLGNLDVAQQTRVPKTRTPKTRTPKTQMPESSTLENMPSLEAFMLHRLAVISDQLDHCCQSFDMTQYFHILHRFCTIDLSAFYFDIRKDCLYCDGKNNLVRQAAIYLLEQVFHSLVRWLAPLIPFTAEEAWQSYQGEGSSIHLQDFHPVSDDWRDDALAKKWQIALDVRRVSLTALEMARKARKIKSSLEATLRIHLSESDFQSLSDIDLKELTLTSSIDLSLAPPPADAVKLDMVKNIAVYVEKAAGEKCQRCWKFETEISQDQLCARCTELCE